MELSLREKKIAFKKTKPSTKSFVNTKLGEIEKYYIDLAQVETGYSPHRQISKVSREKLITIVFENLTFPEIFKKIGELQNSAPV